MPFEPIYASGGIRAVEQAAQAGLPAPSLMERAGLAAAELARRIAEDRARSVLVAAGPGNNGGDAFELAVHLKRWFYRVDVCFPGERAKLPRDAADALAKWEQAAGTLLPGFPAEAALRRYGLIVDGLFGIGLARPLEPPYAECVERINRSGVRVLSLDVPSGLNADSGAIMGVAIRATHTLTFIALKPGLLTLDGPDHCGALAVDNLGLDVERLQAPEGRLLSREAVLQAVGMRPRNFHKGLAGDVAVVGGAAGMVGAALLAARAALACGAGRVHACLLDEAAPRVDAQQPELMLRAGSDLPARPTVIAAGPGLGRSAAAATALEDIVKSACPLVLDADALNLAAERPGVAAGLRARTQGTVMTPHPAEAGRLLGMATPAVQADRIAAARAIAERFRAHVALKGNGTVLADPQGRWWINPTGHPGMASAGMGDALTGIIASLLAQGAQPLAALLAGVWLHGAAGDAAAKANGGPIGTTATDVIAQARRVLNETLYPAA